MPSLRAKIEVGFEEKCRMKNAERKQMTVSDLIDLLSKVITKDAPVFVSHEGDTFFEGDPIMGIQIMHNMVEGNNEVKVFVCY